MGREDLSVAPTLVEKIVGILNNSLKVGTSFLKANLQIYPSWLVPHLLVVGIPVNVSDPGYLYDADKHEHVDRRMSVISTRSSQYPIRTLNTFTSVAAQPISHVVSFYTSTKCELEVFDTAKQYHSTFVQPDFEVFFRKYSSSW